MVKTPLRGNMCKPTFYDIYLLDEHSQMRSLSDRKRKTLRCHSQKYLQLRPILMPNRGPAVDIFAFGATSAFGCRRL